MEQTKAKSNVATRVWTATIFVAVMLIGMLGGKYTYIICFGIINGLCLWEFYSFALGKGFKRYWFRNTLAMLLGMTPYIYSGLVQMQYVSISLQSLLIVLFIFYLSFLGLCIIELFNTSAHALAYLSFLILGVVYISGAFAILNYLAFKEGVYQLDIVTGIVLLVWTNDTAAYFVGSRFGKTPLFPRISPKKTWEGSIGAALITLIIAFPVSIVFPTFTFPVWLIITVIIFIAGGIGDLVESMFKRSIQLKDSSSLLPGHGGFLDRFDAFIFAVPFVAAFLVLFTDLLM
ncbi:MAG: phosphatidate cytidylyltransferase [Bacteroidota bacterium]